MTPRVYVRADANGRVGWGHVVRTGALAEALQDRGHAVTWLALDSDDAALARLRRTFPVTLLEGEIVRGGRARLPFAPAPGDWILLDRYGWGAREHRALRQAGLRVLCVDDEGRGRFDADLVVNPNFGAETLTYRGGARRLLGPAYACLRREFRERRPPALRPAGPARRALVTFGGSDPRALSPRVARLLKDVDPRLRVTVVQGPSAPAASFPPGTRVARNVTAARMRRLMEGSDFAVLAPSSTCWELAYLGVPFALLGYAENQRAVGRRLRAAGLAADLGWYDARDDGRITAGLRRLAADAAARRRMSKRLRAEVDGRGVERLRKAMGL